MVHDSSSHTQHFCYQDALNALDESGVQSLRACAPCPPRASICSYGRREDAQQPTALTLALLDLSQSKEQSVYTRQRIKGDARPRVSGVQGVWGPGLIFK